MQRLAATLKSSNTTDVYWCSGVEDPCSARASKEAKVRGSAVSPSIEWLSTTILSQMSNSFYRSRILPCLDRLLSAKHLLMSARSFQFPAMIRQNRTSVNRWEWQISAVLTLQYLSLRSSFERVVNEFWWKVMVTMKMYRGLNGVRYICVWWFTFDDNNWITYIISGSVKLSKFKTHLLLT